MSIRYNNKKSETKNLRKRKASSISIKEKRMHHDQDTSKVMAEISNTNLQDRDNGVENSFTNPINKAEKENEFVLGIEQEERKLALLERQIKLRREAAEVEAMELQNRKLKISLGLDT